MKKPQHTVDVPRQSHQTTCKAERLSTERPAVLKMTGGWMAPVWEHGRWSMDGDVDPKCETVTLRRE